MLRIITRETKSKFQLTIGVFSIAFVSHAMAMLPSSVRVACHSLVDSTFTFPTQGAVVGFLSSMSLSLWIIVGAFVVRPYSATLPTSVANCWRNSTDFVNTTASFTFAPQVDAHSHPSL